MLNKTALLFYVFTLLSLSSLSAQDRGYDIFQLGYLYDEVKFDQVIVSGRKLLKNPARLDKKELLYIHKYLALSFYNTGQRDSSRSHFYTLLTLDPGFEPDPVQTSPKILSFFQKIKNSFEQDLQAKTVIPYKDYVFVEDIRPAAGWRSLLLPGWGQMYKQQKSKAYLFGGAFVSASLITGIAYIFENDLRQKYLNEKNVDQVEARYTDYNTMSKTRRVMEYATLALWAASVADALFSAYDPMLQPQADKDYLGLSLQIRF